MCLSVNHLGGLALLNDEFSESAKGKGYSVT